MRWGSGEDRATSTVASNVRPQAAVPRHAAWAFVFDLFLSAGRALALGDAGASDVLWRQGGTWRTSGRRTRGGMVVAEARRTRNGVYLMVARARGARRTPPRVVAGLLVAIVILGIWLALRARFS